MTIDFYDGGNDDALFNVLGRGFYAQKTIQTALGTTVPTEIEDILSTFDNVPTPSAELQDTVSSIPAAYVAENISISQTSTIQSALRNLLTVWVDEDATLNPKNITTALTELIEQMAAGSISVDASTVGITVTAGGSNTGTGVILTSIKGHDGLVRENAYAETVNVSASSATSLRCIGEPLVSLLNTAWPRGSGAGKTLAVADAASSLLLNGDMEDEDDVANSPDDWIVSVGTVGTTIKMTDVEVQTLTVTGTPTTGYYLWQISYDSVTLTTGPLAYNASASDLQTAIRGLHDDFAAVTVTATGTTPNFTHTITFVGCGGNLNQHTVVEVTDSGTYTPATTTAGTAFVYAGGKAVFFDSDAATLDTLNQRVTLSPETAYAISLWSATDSVPAAGQITIDLVDGIGGNIIEDKQGMRNSLRFASADLTTSFQHLSALVDAVNEVQTLTITGTPDGGTFTLTFDGVTTATIAYNADAAAVQSALVALANVNTGDVVCGGGALPGTPVTITFGGRYAGRNMPLITADGSSLTGGTTPAAAVALTTQGSPGECVFRTPAVLPDAVYLRIRQSIATSNTSSVFFDHVALAEMTELYNGGPLAKPFAGRVAFDVNDTWTIAVTNNRAGEVQEWFNRNFDMAKLGLLLPSDPSGNETIPDSIVG